MQAANAEPPVIARARQPMPTSTARSTRCGRSTEPPRRCWSPKGSRVPSASLLPLRELFKDEAQGTLYPDVVESVSFQGAGDHQDAP